MTLRKIAVIAVDREDEIASFYGWLSRNRAAVIAISDNEGCGCCVDMFVLELHETVEPMPCESAGDFGGAELRFGQEKDIVISTALDYRLGSTEPDASPNSRPPSRLPESPDVQLSDLQRTSASGGCERITR